MCWDCETVGTVKQSRYISMCRGWRPWSSLCTHGSPVIIRWLCISSSGETRKCDLLSQIWPWRSSSVATQNNRYLNQTILHLWTKFGDLNLNGWWLVVRTSSKWGKFWLLSKIWPWRSRLISPKTIGTLTKVFCIFGSNLVILAWMGPELSRGQASDWYTDTQKQATTIPGGQNWPLVKKSTVMAWNPQSAQTMDIIWSFLGALNWDFTEGWNRG